MKIFKLLMSLLALGSVAIADNDPSTKQQQDSPFLEFLEAVMTIYVREKFLDDRDVLEYAAEIEETLVNEGI